MLRYSVANAINFLSLPEAQRLVTPNLVAAVPAGGGSDDGKGWWMAVDAMATADKELWRAMGLFFTHNKA